MTAEPLTSLQRRILEFEQAWPPARAGKAAAIRETFAMSAARYQQILLSLRHHPEAVRAAPELMNRLVRAGAARRATPRSE
ncbi:DUF3263 domain-containing protein [Pseudoclavibacter soli]|uniref:DUF3263 domain-containing protein n=1 Tax=Pseudoclavibacter soli TaxID=452623 RepID=UPI0003F4D462|nr:DUF3263 domain-containing protein [Pseudoclavibacter soli]